MAQFRPTNARKLLQTHPNMMLLCLLRAIRKCACAAKRCASQLIQFASQNEVETPFLFKTNEVDIPFT